MKDPQSILITGASSGIGAALARAYAAPGLGLALSGRHRERLDRVAADCRAAGAEVATGLVDVCARDELAAWMAGRDRERPLDLVIANAGISAGTGAFGETDHQARQIFEVNFDGVVNTVLAAAAARSR